jgi:hypothetical protein
MPLYPVDFRDRFQQNTPPIFDSYPAIMFGENVAWLCVVMMVDKINFTGISGYELSLNGSRIASYSARSFQN